MQCKPAILSKNIQEIADPLLGDNFSREAMQLMADLALRCLKPFSLNRPSMDELCLGLKNIKMEFFCTRIEQTIVGEVENSEGSISYSLPDTNFSGSGYRGLVLSKPFVAR
jgi:hypothetical protein